MKRYKNILLVLNPEVQKTVALDNTLSLARLCYCRVLGNTVEEVLNQVDCSVLILKPESFVKLVILG